MMQVTITFSSNALFLFNFAPYLISILLLQGLQSEEKNNSFGHTHSKRFGRIVRCSLLCVSRLFRCVCAISSCMFVCVCVHVGVGGVMLVSVVLIL